VEQNRCERTIRRALVAFSRRVKLAARAKWVASFAVVLLVSSVAPVFADSLSGQSASGTQEALLSPPGLREQVESQTKAREELSSPSAIAEREESRQQFQNLGEEEAAREDKKAFPSLFDDVLNPAPRLSTGESITGYPTPYVAQLALPGGERAAVESQLPMVATDSSGKQAPVDLSLTAASGVVEPVNPLVAVTIPRRLSEGLALADHGLTLTPVDGEGQPLGGSFGEIEGAAVFYANTGTDADTVVKPAPAGVETQTVLRSPASPETLRFGLSAEEKPTLSRSEDGSIAIEAAGKAIAAVLPVSAVDAAGTPVPVTTEVENDEVVLTVDHRSDEYRYPIVAGSAVVAEDGPQANRTPFAFGTNNSAAFKGGWDSEGPSSAGFLIEEAGGEFGYGDAGLWGYRTQGSSHIYEFDARIGALHYAAVDNLVGLLDPGGWDGYSWLGTGPLREGNAVVCAEEGCISEGGSEGNAALWEAVALESGTRYRGELDQAAVKIAQQEGPSVGFDTEDKQIEGHPNPLYESGAWIRGGTQAELRAIATDPGLGIYRRGLTSPDEPGWGSKTAYGPAEGCRGVQCRESYGMTADAGELPEGSDTIEAKVENATGATATATAQVKVDRTPPALALAGSMTEQGTLGDKWPSYTLEVDARDGVAKRPQSGVAKATIEVDGKVVAEAAPGCATENCSIARRWTLTSSDYSPGQHTVEVAATDAVGLTTTRTLTIDLQPAPPPASTSPSGMHAALASSPEVTAEEIAVLPTLDPLNRSESPLSDEGKWSALAWDTSTSGHDTGRDTTGGWGPYDAYSKINGAYWNPSTFNDKTGDAASIKMQTSPGGANRYLALWLDMSGPDSEKSGYQLRWTVNSGNSYAVKLSKWSEGSETVLASKASVTIEPGTTMAISDTGGTVSAWEGTNGSLSSLLSAEDSSFAGGYAGIEGSGNISRSTDFKAGVLLGEAIGEVPVLDDLERQEVPLATGDWSKTAWAPEIGGAWMGSYRGYGTNGGLAGAYWNQTSFSDAQGGTIAAANVGTGSPYKGEYLALWLDMPDPGSARSGYEARFTGTDGSSEDYEVELSKWEAGTRTVLDSTATFSLPLETTIALTESGGGLVLWTGTEAMTPLLSATDSTYTAGYAGLEVNGGAGTEYDFRAGSLSATAEELASMPVTEPFDGGSESLKRFNTEWSTLGWAGGSTPKGSDTTSGWRPVNAYATVNGAYYDSAISDTGSGIAAAATMAADPELTSRYFSLWLDMPTPASTRAGYELRFTDTATDTYEVKLSKWVGGTQTVLASESEYAFSDGNSFALADEGGTVSAWTDTGSGFGELLSAPDATFSGGNAGIQGAGNITRLTDFKLGTLGSAPPDTTITGGPEGVVVPDVSFTFSSSQSGSSFECSLDGGAYGSCTSPASYQGLSEGPHTFQVRATSAGGTDETPAEGSFEVIEAARAVTKVRLLDDLERQEVPLATGDWSKTAWTSAIGGTWCCSYYHGYGSSGGLDGAYWNPTEFGDGEGSVLASATVGTGSLWESEYLALWLDMPNPGSARSGYEARFTAAAGSFEDYEVQLSKWVSGTRTVLASTSGFSLPVGTVMALSETAGGGLVLWTGTSAMTSLLSANDSTYSGGYTGLEVDGGEGTEYDFRAGNIDIQPPETTITGGPSGKVLPEEVSFDFTSSEEGSSFECSLDEGAFASCTSPKAYPGLAEGSHAFRVRATDAVGNQDETPAERSFEVVEPPQTTITSPQPTYTGGSPDPIEFTSDKQGSTFECTLEQLPSHEIFPLSACSSPYQLPEHLQSGWYRFTVTARDSESNADPTPAEWTFNPAPYPEAPSTSKLISPEEGRKSAHYFTLKSEWAIVPEGGGVSSVSYELKLPGWTAFKDIPSKYLLDSEGNRPGWALPVNESQSPPVPAGESPPLFFDFNSYTEDTPPFPGEGEGGLGAPETSVQLRAVFNGGEDVAGASKPVTTTYARFAGGSGDATEEVGPAAVDLLTGAFTISRTDVSIPVPGSEANLEFTRVYNSAWGANEKTNSKTLGQMWQPSAPVESEYEEQAWQKLLVRHEDAVPAEYEQCTWNEGTETESCVECAEGQCGPCPEPECERWTVEEEIPEANWVEVLDNEGAGISFDRAGSSEPYTYVSPEEAKEFKLTKPGSNFILADSNGTKTEFSENGSSNEYMPSAISFAGTSKTASLTYEISEKKLRLMKMIGPAPSGVTCNPYESEGNYAPKTIGCRTLILSYVSLNIEGGPIEQRLDHIIYYDSSGSGQGQVVARYAYDWTSGNLAAEWDPRVSPEVLEEHYMYESTEDARLTRLTPAGAEPWDFSYYPAGSGGAYEAKLKSVSRASLLEEGPQTATTTIAYDVPILGEGAPHDLSPSTIFEWGQSDYPVDATAIFPPTEVPGEEPSDYDQATVHYLDPNGAEVNVASPSPPGVEGESITTAETDQHGNVVRELGAQARLEALQAEHPVARSHELDTQSTYSEDGTRMLESWGPLHKVRRESTGETVEARAHTMVEYDDPVPQEGEASPNLPTKERVDVVISDVPPFPEGIEPHVTETKYDWSLRKPTESIVDPSGLDLMTKTVYNSQGQVKEERQPADVNNTNPGSDAYTTKSVYWTAGENSENQSCGGKARWAGLLCVTHPVAAPFPAGSRPAMPWTWFTEYSSLGQPERIEEKTPSGTVKRTTTLEYDEAGRQLTTQVTGEGTGIPAVETTYNSKTGAPESQQFVCEEECEGFDSRQVNTTYDKLGRPVEYEDADGNVSGVAYDLLGRPVIASDGKGYQEISYDEGSGVATEMADSAAGTFKATYNADGQMTEQLLPDGLAQKISYNPAGEAIALAYEKQTFCSSACTWLSFAREDSIGGQVLREESTLGNHEYSYDKAGRLTLAKEYGLGGSCTTRSYAFEGTPGMDSNRTSLIMREPKENGACDTDSEGSKQTYNYDTADRLIGEGVEYDNLGRITSLPAKYSGGGELETSYYVNDLTQSQTQDGITNTYELDAALRERDRTRTGGSEEGTEIYHYAGGSDSPAWIEEVGERETTWTRNVGALGGSLGAIQKSNGEVTLQLADMHGDIVATAAIDPEATELLSSQRFDEFGNPEQSGFLQGGSAEYGWLGAKGRRTQLPSGVVQMGKRSYVPEVGRFISTDPVKGGSANAYDYANADPVNGFDLMGTRPYGNDCLPGYAGCQCKLHVKLWSHRRGRMGVRIRRRCNRVGGITKTGYEVGYYKHDHSWPLPGVHFKSIPTPHFVRPTARVEPVCRPTDPCQQNRDFKGTFVCEPGEEYKVRVTWGFYFNLGQGAGQEHQLHVEAEEHCAT
jgi:RHS repeat-associated protein